MPAITYGGGLLSIKACGQSNAGGSSGLYMEQIGPNETGQGLAFEYDREIDSSSFMNLDHSNLVAHSIFS